MSTVMEIEKAIEGLNPEELQELLSWLSRNGPALGTKSGSPTPAWPDFASRQREVFGARYTLPAGYVDVLINEDRGE